MAQTIFFRVCNEPGVSTTTNNNIGIGRSALEASALTLRTTAELLRAVSERLEAEEPQAEATSTVRGDAR